MTPMSPLSPRKQQIVSITAIEEDDECTEEEDVIPGPPSNTKRERSERSTSSHRKGSILSRVLNTRRGKHKHQQQQDSAHSSSAPVVQDELQLSLTEHHWAGAGILASRADLELPAADFAAGCNLLQAAARGDRPSMEALLVQGRTSVDFRDYDRRTALHVAASEGHLAICRFLLEEKGAKINRSDRWGGSPLDDAHRHRHQHVVTYLRGKGATTGSGNKVTNLIKAAADGDLDEVKILMKACGGGGGGKQHCNDVNINTGDYDKRTALHLAAGEGHAEIVVVLCEAGANVNAEDRWMRRPLDDADDGNHDECVRVLEKFGASRGSARMNPATGILDKSSQRQADNLKIDFGELEMIDRIGAGAFGEIYKCRWRGTLVAAKIIKSAKIRKDWLAKQMMQAIKDGKQDVDDAVKEMDEAELLQDDKDEALADFRQEISVLKSLRHPNIVLMLAYSTTQDHEVMISELMKCSLLDVFKSHMVQGTRMHRRTQMIYATQLAQGMNYLHTCRPPIIHRDLKPANLLIDHSGVLKISDFGLSKVRPDPDKKETDTFTMTGETGSYRFMAPEVYRHEEYNESVDVYSYAMILFYLMVGRPPWPNLSGIAAVRKASDEGDRPNLPRDMDQRLQGLIKDCWSETPGSRPPFDQILMILSTYTKSVFHQDSNIVATTAPPQIDKGCACIIL